MFRKKQEKYNFNQLTEYIKKDDVESVRDFAKAGFNFKQFNDRGWTSIHYAACYNSLETTKFLLKRLDLDITNKQSIRPIHLAAWYNATEVFSLLLIEGADFLGKDKHGWSPLALAAWKNHAPIIKLLITAGCRLNTRQDSGYTPLHFAAWNNSGEALKLMLDAKTKPKTHKGITPLLLAQAKRNRIILKYLTGKDEPEISGQKELNSKNLRQFIRHNLSSPPNPPILYQTKKVHERREIKKQEKKQIQEQVKRVQTNKNIRAMQLTQGQLSTENPQTNTYFSKIAIDQLKQASDGHADASEPQHYAVISLSGNKLANKTEAIIANILHSMKIPFYYQRKICGTVNLGVYYPAFSFFDKNNKLMIWEHLSGLANQQARTISTDCRRWYQNNGFVLGQNFFLTSDQNNRPFDSRVALHIGRKIKRRM